LDFGLGQLDTKCTGAIATGPPKGCTGTTRVDQSLTQTRFRPRGFRRLPMWRRCPPTRAMKQATKPTVAMPGCVFNVVVLPYCVAGSRVRKSASLVHIVCF